MHCGEKERGELTIASSRRDSQRDGFVQGRSRKAKAQLRHKRRIELDTVCFKCCPSPCFKSICWCFFPLPYLFVLHTGKAEANKQPSVFVLSPPETLRSRNQLLAPSLSSHNHTPNLLPTLNSLCPIHYPSVFPPHFLPTRIPSSWFRPPAADHKLYTRQAHALWGFGFTAGIIHRLLVGHFRILNSIYI
jgi:hypothetical protein